MRSVDDNVRWVAPRIEHHGHGGGSGSGTIRRVRGAAVFEKGRTLAPSPRFHAVEETNRPRCQKRSREDSQVSRFRSGHDEIDRVTRTDSRGDILRNGMLPSEDRTHAHVGWERAELVRCARAVLQRTDRRRNRGPGHDREQNYDDDAMTANHDESLSRTQLRAEMCLQLRLR
jgi:hypothetical protein